MSNSKKGSKNEQIRDKIRCFLKAGRRKRDKKRCFLSPGLWNREKIRCVLSLGLRKRDKTHAFCSIWCHQMYFTSARATWSQKSPYFSVLFDSGISIFSEKLVGFQSLLWADRAKHGVFVESIIKKPCFLTSCICNMCILPESGPFFFLGIVKNTCFLLSWIPKSVILP